MAQLFLFEESEEDRLQRRMSQIEQKYDALRKGQYAKITKLQSEVKMLIEQMEFLQSNIAKKGYYL
jgi:ABC-type phosphate transport system auxiliary subunit